MIKKSICGLAVGLACIAFAGMAGPVFAQSAQAEAKTIAYTPPMRGAPTNRVGGASRGAAQDMPLVAVLSPDHTGLTSKEQPTLYWFLSGPLGKGYVEFSLSEENAVAPVLEKRLNLAGRSGLMAVSLAEHQVALKPDVDYLWNVAIVLDPEQRSHDIVATAAVRRVTAKGELGQQIAGADQAEQATLYAREGLWYDALDALDRLMAERPADPRPRRLLSELLGQVGLNDLGKTLANAAGR